MNDIVASPPPTYFVFYMSEVCFVNKKSTNDLFFFAFTNSQDIRRMLITPCFDFLIKIIIIPAIIPPICPPI